MNVLNGVVNLAKGVGKYIDYWNEYKNERIVIIDREVSYDFETNEIKIFNHLIEGEVNKVLLIPPGFKLKDVEEKISIKRYQFLFGAGSKKILDSERSNISTKTIRKVKEKHIYFSAIDQIELKEYFKKREERLMLEEKNNKISL
ncbi:MAG: hypothetical protein ACOC7O_00640 [Thermoplasmatota archaeon]